MDRGEVPNSLNTAFNHEISDFLCCGCGNSYDADMNAHSLGKIHQSFQWQYFLAPNLRADPGGISIKCGYDIEARTLKPLVPQQRTSQMSCSN